MVSTSSPLAAMAGMRAFEQGGNACDAALAAASVLTVVEPNQCGPGGDLFALVVRDGERPIGLNASGRSPADPGDLLPTQHGPQSVTVPGCVSGWTELADRCSRLGVASAMQHGIDVAERGFTIAPRNREEWEADYGQHVGAAAAEFKPSDPFCNPSIWPAVCGRRPTAASTRASAARRSSPARGSRSPTWMRTRNDWVDPSSSRSATTPCSSCRPTVRDRSPGWAAEALGDELGPPAQVEALAAAYDRGYASIGGTSYVCAADGDGMGVSLIQSIFWGFGSHVLAEGCGFMLQNRGSGSWSISPATRTTSRPPSGRSTRSCPARSSARAAAGARCWA